MGVEGSLVPTDLGGGRSRRKSWFGDQGGDAASTSGGKGNEGGQHQLQSATNPNSRVRRGSLVTAPGSGSNVDNQHGGEGATKRLREQVKVIEGCKIEINLRLQVMQKPSREAQKSFTWDATVGPAISVDANAGQPRK